jgi:hypothetical protein
MVKILVQVVAFVDTHGLYTSAEYPSCRKYDFERSQRKKTQPIKAGFNAKRC